MDDERSTPGDDLVLQIAAQPRSVALARLFAAGAARDAGCDEETIDDIKIAVSEAVTSALRADDGEGIVSVRVGRDGARLEVRVERPLQAPGAAPRTDDADLGMAVIAALFPDVTTEGGNVIRFAVPLAMSAPADLQ